jgi:two-component system response regulator YesN
MVGFSAVDRLDGPADRKGFIPSQEIQKAISFIDQHLLNGLSIGAVASAVGLGQNRFSRKFRREMRMNYFMYVHRVRVRMAKPLLLKTRKEVTEISGLVGYDDSNTFAKYFRQHTKMSPTEYRRKLCSS